MKNKLKAKSWLIIVYTTTALLFLGCSTYSPKAHAVCPVDSSSWPWDNDDRKTCVPCDFTGTLGPSHKYNEHCNSGGGSNSSSSFYVGFKVTWMKQDAGNSYELQMQRNNFGWSWIHTAERNDSNNMSFLFTDTLVQYGENVCVRYRISDVSGTWTDYSVNACAQVPNRSTNQGTGLTSPGTISLELY